MKNMEAFLAQVALDLKKRFGDELHQTAIIFNNKRPAIFLKKHLSQIYSKTLLSPSFYTVQEFFALSTQRVIAHEINQFFTLFECYNDLLAVEGKPAESPEIFYPLSQTILSDFNQIDKELVNPDALFTHLKNLGELQLKFGDFTPEQEDFISGFWASFSPENQTAVQERFLELWKRMPTLYHHYHDKLRQKGLIAMSEIYRNLAEGNADNPSFIDSYQSVIFVGFNALSKCEQKLFKQWQDMGKALFYFDADSYFIDDTSQEAGTFIRKNIRAGLHNALGDFPSILQQSASNYLQLFPVSGYNAQAKALGLHLAEKIKDSSIEQTHQIAIILADEALLIPTLQSIPDELKINVTMGYPIHHSQVYQLIKNWLSIQQELQKTQQALVTAHSLQTFLETTLLELEDTLRDELLTKKKTLSATDFKLYLTQNVPVAALFFTRITIGTQAIEALRTLLSFILEQKKSSKQIPLLEGHLMLRTLQELNQLEDQLNSHSLIHTIPLTLRLIENCLSGLIAPVEGTPLEGVQLMGLLESRCLDFEEVYLLGANEGILPQHGSGNTFIPDSLRRAFQLPLSEDRDAISAYLFYRLILRAKHIHIYYNSLVDENSSGEVSRFVKQLDYESKLDVTEHPQGTFAKGVAPEFSPLILEKTDTVLNNLNQYLVDEGKAFSASALKMYLDCPLRFFAKYIAHIPEPDTDTNPFDPIKIGNVVHGIMDEFYRPFLNNQTLITSEIIRIRLQDVDKICNEKLVKEDMQQQYLDGQPDGRYQIAKEIILEDVRHFLEHDISIAPFKIIAIEENVNQSLEMDLRGQGTLQKVNFKGIIDRVDEVNGITRIVDYKTGGDKLQFGNDLNSLFDHVRKEANPAAFQILFYALLYYKKTKRIPQAHLYAIQEITAHNSAIYSKDKSINSETLATQETMIELEDMLGKLMREMYNPNLPFQHNEHNKYCANSPYEIFCHESAIHTEIEEE